ncbi:MAG: hypothetical protein LBJ23_06545 [Tannerella sp.]|jgi:hypothetical protein|nr:hypothetical protein [Tannerella sp.]
MNFTDYEKVTILKKWMFLCVSACCLFCALGGCESINDYSTNPNHRLTFSVDTLSFDTIFSTVGSTTKQFMVYNPNDEALRIEMVLLANPGKNGFRINVDGRKGDTFRDIDVWKNDSLYVSVEVTVDPNGTVQPLVVEDSILFYVNGIRQSVLLQAYGQDVHLLKGGVTITRDTTFVADIPYLIYDSLKIAEGATATIEKGVTMYMHNGANLIVDGTIKVKGTQESPVTIRGDRLDDIKTSVLLPYDRTPGQWGGICFGSSSFENEFYHVIVRNGVTGLVCRESQPDRMKIHIRHSQITNMSKYLLLAINCHIEASDSEFSNATDSTVALVGGKYQFTHCTIASYNILTNRNRVTPCLVLSNRWVEGTYKTSYALQQAYFDNCIIDGGHSADSTNLYSGELWFDVEDENMSGNSGTFNYRFNSCFVKTARLSNERFVNNLFIHSPSYLKTGTKEDEYVYDFRLANKSVGIGNADRSISEKYPVDRYGVDRLSAAEGPSIGAYEYVYQKEAED